MPGLLRVLSYRNTTPDLPGQPCGWWQVPGTEVRMPPRDRRQLQVRVTFEPSRLAPQHLHDAYDQVLPPPLRRRIGAPPATARIALPPQNPPEQERA